MLDPEDSSFRLWIDRKGKHNHKPIGVRMILVLDLWRSLSPTVDVDAERQSNPPMFERKLNALQIKVSLAEIRPSVWRRLIVPATWHLGELHLAIQAAFNWWDCHLHEFRIGGLRYGDPDILEEGSFEDDARVFDEREVRLRDFSREDGISFSYIYDLGDNWVHTVEIEKHVSLDVAPRIAACVAGERARPPEDVGGVSGYENFLAIMADPTDDEHIDTKRWCGGHFDRDWFDLAMTDKDVRNALRANVRRRMHQPKPRRTSHQIN